MDTGLKAKMSPSLALLTIVNLTPAEHNVIIVNENISRVDFDYPADLVAITVTVDVLNRAAQIAGAFRKRGVSVVAGGIHITADPENALPFFDAVCVGRDETTWPKLLGDIAEGRLRKIYYDDHNDPTICAPNYHVPDAKKYIYNNIVSASRGCPFRCAFCYNSCNKATPYLNRPAADVLRDIEAIHRKHILFVDDNFIGNPQWTREFLTALLPYRVKWSAAVSANILDYPELLDLMEQSGCQSLFIGFETINQQSLDAVHKRQNHTARYEDIVRELHRRGVMVNASIVFGLPGDGPDVFRNTLDWMMAHKVETVTAHILTPYPGSALYRDMLAKNLITDFDLSHYNTAHVVFRPEKMSAEQLYQGYIRFYKELYSFKNILKRIPDNRRQRIPYLCFNLLYRKYGGFTELLSRVIPLELLGQLAARISYKQV